MGLYHFRRHLAALLLGLFALVQLNSVVFRHAHRLPDGSLITHAHPFRKGPGGKPLHGHTTAEFVHLHLLTHGLYLPEVAFVPLFVPEATDLPPAAFWLPVVGPRQHLLAATTRGPPVFPA